MPRKTENRSEGRRTHQLNVRVTDEEYEFIRMRAEMAGRSVTDYVAWRCVYMDKTRQMPPRAEVAKLLRELGAQGTNLNQIAHACNRIATMDLGDHAERSKALRSLEVIRVAATDARKDLVECYQLVMDAWNGSGMER